MPTRSGKPHEIGRTRLHAWRLAGVVSLVLAAALGGCTEEHALLITLSAEARVDTFDLHVMDRSTGEVLLEQLGEPVDADDPTRDISEPGQELRLAITFARPGSYVVHVVGHSNGPTQASTHLYYVTGTSRRTIRLVAVGTRDRDGDGFVTAAVCEELNTPDINCDLIDCDDGNAAVNPLATEICGNGIDENCDGEDPTCLDRDGDGSPENEDCDDNDPERYPGNLEAPNDCPTAEHPNGIADPQCGDGIDQDCDGQDTACIIDADCDGVPADRDCDDTNPDIRPGASEICNNGIDENCSGVADEGCVPCDLDGDGYERFDEKHHCPSDTYPVSQPLDCDDLNAAVHPELTSPCGGQEGGDPTCALLQLCDGIDNDCDGEIDEGCPDPACDNDHDGFQHTGGGCSPPPGFEDCDDTDPLVYPGAPDHCGDGILQNCNTDTACDDDNDGDGFNATDDCDDTNPEVYPGALEVCNGIDDDCDGVVDEGNPDADGVPMVDIFCNDDPDGICGVADGAGRCVCTKVTPTTQLDTGRVMCVGEDLSARASPRCFFAPQPEIEQCDDTDHDCDGRNDDPTGDNLLEVGQACGSNVGHCEAGQVVGCDYSQTTAGALNPHFLCDSAFVPPSAEICNADDDDCDGDVPDNERDHDGDRYLGCTGCGALPSAYLGCNDCAPYNGAIHPNATEHCNNVDDDCDPSTPDGQGDCGAGSPDCCGGLNLCVDFDTDMSHCGDCTTSCNSFVANRCSGGHCRCGSGAPCSSGQQCVGTGTSATCQCTSASCGGGCCDGTTCVAYGSQNDGRCGTDGESCHGCQNGRTCSNSGVCLCFGDETPPNESSCGDNVDNDCDGDTDCADANCNGDSCGAHGRICSGGSCVCSGNGGTAQSTESLCSDGHDNDCDGNTDCADGNCDGASCGANGRICSGSTCVCSGNGGTAQSTESTCNDGHDNDCDGSTDCDDGNCDGASCGANGRICSGTSCVCSGNGGTAQSSESICDDGHDNDCNGSADCADANCDGQTCGSHGQVCSGTSCVCSGNGGTVQSTETSCNDGHDNDCDGDVDCADANCNGVSCGSHGLICSGGSCICSGNGGTAQSSESICDDNRDNDCDGNIDCDDSQCDGQTCDGTRICVGTSCQ